MNDVSSGPSGPQENMPEENAAPSAPNDPKPEAARSASPQLREALETMLRDLRECGSNRGEPCGVHERPQWTCAFCLYNVLTQLGQQAAPAPGSVFDFRAHLQHQGEWSRETFGPGARTAGVVDHIRKELREIEADPEDISEWIDAVILALDGAWRAGHTPESIIEALVAKQAKNEARTWPDWRTFSEGVAIEHVRPAPPGRDTL